ncbi:MAG: hypothetical protein ACFB4J_18835 [Elainellaceae cyanobacterium]
MTMQIYRIQYANDSGLVKATLAGLQHYIQSSRLPITGYSQPAAAELQDLYDQGAYISWQQCAAPGCTHEADGLDDELCQEHWEDHCAQTWWQFGAQLERAGLINAA